MQFENVETFDIEGLMLITPKVFGDNRGFFKETYSKKDFAGELGVEIDFVQDNFSHSGKDILRGLHWQTEPYAQDKLVRVARGKLIDVAVDIRKDSPTFGQHVKVELSEENHKIFLVPKGFAHGFLTLTDIVDFEYKVSNYYAPDNDRGIAWNDPDLGIDWGVESPILSEKDTKHPFLKDIDKNDLF